MKKQTTLKDRINRMIYEGALFPSKADDECEEKGVKGLTLRFDAVLRQWIRHVAKSLGLSQQDVVQLLMSSMLPESVEMNKPTPYQRIEQWANAHNVDVFSLPNVFMPPLKRSDFLESPETINSVLTRERLAYLAMSSGVELDWLQARSDQALPLYGHFLMEESKAVVADYHSQSEVEIEVFFVVDNKEVKSLSEGRYLASVFGLGFAVVLKLTSIIGNQMVTHYRVSQACNSYDEVDRQYYRSLIETCYSCHVPCIGVVLTPDEFNRLSSGSILAGQVFQSISTLWYPNLDLR